MSGALHLVGVGPGDPELLTLKAVRVIAAADVVAFPRKPGTDSMALAIARQHLPATAERMPVDIPMNPDPAPAVPAYDACADAIATHVDAGRSVVWLCEGDPLFYGTAIQLLDRLAGRIAVTVVPGVTSLTAAAASAGRALASRNEVFKLLPAPLPDETLAGELASGAAAVIKLGRHFDRVRALLADLGRDGDAVVVEHATGPDERITPLRAFAGDGRPYFSTILVGQAAEPGA